MRLDAAGFDDLLGHAETWERVLRKLSVRAMPPQGSPRPTEAEYAAFTGWLAASLDRAWEGRSTPGRYVVHRLNRAEYANAVRDLLAVEIDVSDLLPTDGAEFGFDNIATALKTSPLLLEGYVNAAQRVSAMAVGDPQVRPGTTEHSISPRIQPERLHRRPAARDSRRHGRPSRIFRLTPSINCRAGWSGAFRKATPASKGMTCRTRSSSPWMALKCIRLRLAVPRTPKCRAPIWPRRSPIIDKRMTGRVRVTAGPHDVGFTWKERPVQLQDVWEPSKRDSQEIHMVAGLPKLRTVSIDGPYNVQGH